MKTHAQPLQVENKRVLFKSVLDMQTRLAFEIDFARMTSSAPVHRCCSGGQRFGYSPGSGRAYQRSEAGTLRPCRKAERLPQPNYLESFIEAIFQVFYWSGWRPLILARRPLGNRTPSDVNTRMAAAHASRRLNHTPAHLSTQRCRT